MATLYDALEDIRRCVPMHLGERSVTAIYHFVLSVAYLRDRGLLSLEPEDPDFSGFHEWIRARRGRRESTPGWCRMLLEESGGDEREALERFFQELDAFRATGAR